MLGAQRLLQVGQRAPKIIERLLLLALPTERLSDVGERVSDAGVPRWRGAKPLGTSKVLNDFSRAGFLPSIKQINGNHPISGFNRVCTGTRFMGLTFAPLRSPSANPNRSLILAGSSCSPIS